MWSFNALIKREYWEHKGAMLYAPAIMAVVFAILLILAWITSDSIIVDSSTNVSLFDILPKALQTFESLAEKERRQGVQIGLYAPLMLFGFVMFVVSLFYSLGSLYDERKDRSILFWKSLPVTDASTVLSKYTAVTVLIPLMYFSVIALFQVFLMLFSTVGAWFSGTSGLNIWMSSNLFLVLLHTLFSLVIASLWLAPIWAWLMFASSWAKKVAFLWGTLPIFMIAVAEAWLFHSAKLLELIGARIEHGFATLNSNIHFLLGGDLFNVPVLHWYQIFSNIEFWLGLMLSSIFLTAAIYIRRYKGEC